MIGPNVEELWLKESELKLCTFKPCRLETALALVAIEWFGPYCGIPDDAYYRVAILPTYNLIIYICFLTCTSQ